MIGKAASGLMPSRLTRIRHGAYRPTPNIINAPSRQLAHTPNTSAAPWSPRASPPAGNQARFFASISAAATNSATPMPSWMMRLGARATMPAPNQAPTTAATIIPHAPLHLEDGGRGREGSDTQRVEEVGRKAYQDIRAARLARPARGPLEGKPAPQVPKGCDQERRQERVSAVEVQGAGIQVSQSKRRRSKGVTSWAGSRPATRATIRSAVTGARVNPRCWWPMA